MMTDQAWQTVRSALEERRRAVMAELRAYPPRVAGCDVQFNALLEARQRLGEALRALDAGETIAPESLAAIVDAASLDDAARSLLQDLIKQK
jgi:hypothetical protein